MKKIMTYAAFSAIAILAVFSCQKDIREDTHEDPVEKPAIVFSATTEEPVTKTALSGNDLEGYVVNWANGDEITIVDAASNAGVYSTTSTTAQGTFTYASGAEVSVPDYAAYYPASLYNGGTPTLPDIQTYTPGNIVGAPMYATSSTTDLQFKNLCGILRLNVTTTMPGQKVRSIGLLADQQLCGAFGIVSDAAVPTSGLENDRFLSMDCGAEGIDISSTPTSFYFSIPPGDYTGLRIHLYTTEGLTQVKVLKADKTVTIERSTITDISLSYNALAAVNVSQPSPWSGSPNNYWFGPASYVKITGSNTDYIIRVGRNTTIIMDNATIKRLYSRGDMTVVAENTNKIQIENGQPFYVEDDYPGNVIIRGTGSLTSLTGNGANSMGSEGTKDVVIESGTIHFDNLYGESGSSKGLVARSLTITGGDVNIQGGSSSKDVGIGVKVEQDILITAGTVYTWGKNAMRAGGNITITGGNITAVGTNCVYSSEDYTGILAAGTVSITGGKVKASGGPGSPGIGIRNGMASCGDIIITGGTVTAIGDSAAGIGTGSAAYTCGNITIGPRITKVLARKGSASMVAPIGQGYSGSTVGTVSIDPSLNMVVSTKNYTDDTWTLTPTTDQEVSNETVDYEHHSLDED